MKLIAYATSAHVFGDKYISIAIIDAYYQSSLRSSPSKSAPTGSPVVGVCIPSASLIPVTLRTFSLNPG